MSANTPSLDMFVTAICEFKEAVADPSYNVTTARERLAWVKGVDFDSQLVEKIRDLIIDIDEELPTTFCPSPMASIEHEKKVAMFRTMSYVAYKAFGKAVGKSESNGSMPASKDLAASVLGDKESEMCVGDSTTSQGKRQAKRRGRRKEKNTKRALNEVTDGKGMSNEDETFEEGVTTDKGEEKEIEPALNDEVTGQGLSEVHEMLAEGTTTDKSEEKQIKPAFNNVVNIKGTGKVDNILHKMIVEGSNKHISEKKIIKPGTMDEMKNGRSNI